MKRSVLTTALLLSLFVSTFALAQPRMGPPPGGERDVLGDYLSLTTEQRTAWRTIQSDLRSSTEALRAQERMLGEELHDALEGTDANAIGSLVLQLHATHEQLRAARESADAKFAALLTSEQKTKFAAFQAAAEFLKGRGPGGPGGPGPR